MRYAFVFLGIIAIWMSLLLLVVRDPAHALYFYCVVLVLTLVFYWLGFRRGRR